MEDLVIIGSGPAGYTAALYAARGGLQPLVITGNLPGGLPTQLADIENYPGFAEPQPAYDLVDAMRQQAEHFGARLHYGAVTALTLTPGGPQQLTLDDGSAIACRALVIATGSRHQELGLPAENALRNKGVSYCAVCDGAFYKGRDVVVAGGSGDAPLVEALYLARFAATVHLVIRKERLSANHTLAERVTATPNIHLYLNTTISQIHDLKLGKVTSVTLKNKTDNSLAELPCAAVFVAMGLTPDTALFNGQLDLQPDGTIVLTDPARSLTSVDGVFAAGDCADDRYRQIVTAAAGGCKAALDALQWLDEHPASES